ncbi:hypothetical protein QQ045_021604 [Rhodiola kirilowii]
MVVGLSCLMASRVYISVLVASQEQSMSRVVKDFLPFLPGPGVRPDITGSDSLKMKSNRLDDSWRSLDGLLEHNTLLKIDSSIRKPVFINPHGMRMCILGSLSCGFLLIIFLLLLLWMSISVFGCRKST